ncbi:MAG: DNA polymerase III subunit delta [Lachnospiraceae bacterium]|nr:DNA polymerase III subunit delta [Lachnospiraceae bacterium]
MSVISDDIKNNTIKPVYLIYGDEAYLRDNYRKALVKALVAPGDNLNYNFFSGNKTDPGEVLSLAETLPFMAEKRVIQVMDSGFFKRSNESIAGYMENPSPDTVLIFVESEVDRKTKAFSAAKKAGYNVEAKRFDEKKLPQWVAANFKRYDKKVSRETVELIIDRAGSDMSALDMEISKLASYAGKRDIVTSEDVITLVHRNPDSNVYQMIEAVADRRLNKAVGIYYDMLAEKESPQHILSLLERQYRIMLTVSDMSGKDITPKEKAEAAGIKETIVWKYEKQAKKYNRARLMNVLDACVRAGREIFQGKIADNVAVELLIIETASL